MGNIDAKKLALAILISFLSCMPLLAWVFLGGTGRLGVFAGTREYHDLTIAVAMVTAAWLVAVMPFVIWPRIFNGPSEGEGSLKDGIPARAVLLERGLEGRGGIRFRKRRNTYLVMTLKVFLPEETYIVKSHLALVPESILPFVREGMEFPVRVGRSDRMAVGIDWEPLLEHYPGKAADYPG